MVWTAGVFVWIMTGTCRSTAADGTPLRLSVYATAGDVVIDWDLASPERNRFPVEEDTRSFADAVKIEILDVATETVQAEDLVDEIGPHTITNAEIVAALGSEVDFLVRVYTQRAGYDSRTYAEIKVLKV